MGTNWEDWEYWVNAFPEFDEMNFDLDADEFRAYVPFEPVGKKQMGRLVYQVIGEDGPAFNPKNIRYLSPGDAGYPSNLPPLNPAQGVNFANLTSVFAGLNLVASVANLAVSAVILHKVSKLERQIEQTKCEILAKLDVIGKKVTHIDIKVREIHLRESLNYLTKACIRGNTIDLEEIKKIERDIEGFIGSIDQFEYGNLDYRFDLSYDMRERLAAFYSLLYHTRDLAAQAHNAVAGGNHSRALCVHPIKDYRSEHYLANCIRSAQTKVRRIREERVAKRMARGDTPSDPIYMRMMAEKKAEEKRTPGLLESLAKGAVDIYSTKRFGEAFFSSKSSAELWREQYIRKEEGLDFLRLLRDPQFSLKESPKPAVEIECESIAREIRAENWKSAEEIAWLWNTDMGLVWRFWKELKGLGNYQKEFPGWSEVDSFPIKTNQIAIDCSTGDFIQCGRSPERIDPNKTRHHQDTKRKNKKKKKSSQILTSSRANWKRPY